MGVDDVLEIGAAVEQLVGLEVRVRVGAADVVAVVRFREEAGGAQDHDRQAMVAVQELAEVLRRGLGDAVDVARDRCDVLGDPGRRRAGRRRERAAERARRARVDEPADARLDSRLEQDERARDVGVDELLAGVRADMRLVQRRGVQDRVRAPQRLLDEVAVGDRPDERRVRRGEDVKPDGVDPVGGQHAAQRLAEVSGAACHEDPHRRRGYEGTAIAGALMRVALTPLVADARTRVR